MAINDQSINSNCTKRHFNWSEPGHYGVFFLWRLLQLFIGAKGLGWNLLLALNQLNIGLALEAGLCISMIAILLDKMSLAWANKQEDYFGNLTFFSAL